MLDDLLLGFMGLIFDNLLNLIPDMKFDIPQSFYDNFHSIFEIIRFFLPLKQLIPLIAISFTINMFRLLSAIFSRVKSMIPGMGG